MKTKAVPFKINFIKWLIAVFVFSIVVYAMIFFIYGMYVKENYNTLHGVWIAALFAGIVFGSLYWLVALMTKTFDYEIKNRMMPTYKGVSLAFPSKELDWVNMPAQIRTAMKPDKDVSSRVYAYCTYNSITSSGNKCLVKASTFTNNIDFVKNGKLFGNWKFQWFRDSSGYFVEAVLIEAKKPKVKRDYKKEYKK